PQIGRELAIKTLYVPQLAGEQQIQEAQQRFTLEAQAAGRLSHPNIVVVYQFGQERDFRYLAMELIPGASLDRLMAAKQHWTPAEIASIVGQIAAALDFAHANQVIHRDVKPANIMLRPDGVVKVTDFGIARVSEQVLTQAGTWGTPVYMAPERINGERGDARADQYALAVMAYQLVAGKLPFEKAADVALLYDILHREPERLSDPALDRAIRRGLAKNPADRYPNCSEFARTLDQALAGPELLTIRTVPPPPLPAVPARRRRSAWVWLLILILGAGAAGYYYYPRPKHTRAPVVSPPPQAPLPYVRTPKAAPEVRTDPVLKEKVTPSRGLWASFRRVKGTVTFDAVIGPDGSVEALTYLSGPKVLEPAAEKAALEYKYEPATLNGQPVEGQTTISVDFAP
ncbi:MAG: protein kinase, partial [Acidobacteriota bacterium]|nr:protein kinase [Acidobacteriota bacterium]